MGLHREAMFLHVIFDVILLWQIFFFLRGTWIWVFSFVGRVFTIALSTLLVASSRGRANPDYRNWLCQVPSRMIKVFLLGLTSGPVVFLFWFCLILEHCWTKFWTRHFWGHCFAVELCLKYFWGVWVASGLWEARARLLSRCYRFYAAGPVPVQNLKTDRARYFFSIQSCSKPILGFLFVIILQNWVSNFVSFFAFLALGKLWSETRHSWLVDVWTYNATAILVCEWMRCLFSCSCVQNSPRSRSVFGYRWVRDGKLTPFLKVGWSVRPCGSLCFVRAWNLVVSQTAVVLYCRKFCSPYKCAIFFET